MACGATPKPGWINVDLGGGADLTLDLREGLPFDDDSAEII
jgi:predicted SAM-dependent methyltransferase